MSGDLITYFLPGFGISRSVIQSEIRYFCGPDAIVRPFTHKVGDQRGDAGPVLTVSRVAMASSLPPLDRH